MHPYLQKSPYEQKIFVEQAAAQTGRSPVVIEKDFWVCWMLGQLFDLTEFGPHLTFKGGTSLSKVYGLISRFSEDIDLSFQREFLGFGGNMEPERGTSSRERERRIEDLQTACVEAIQSRLLPSLRQTFDNPTIRCGDRLEISEADPQTILFHYPSCLETGRGRYIRPVVKVELGARSDHWPQEQRAISSYLDETFGSLWKVEKLTVNALSAERTFWEKATILHAEHHRSEDKVIPVRQSRHYYDLYCMLQNEIGQRAIGNLELLKRVVDHKKVFFRSSWANYENAKPGSLRLMPAEHNLQALMQDYHAMEEMFFEPPPTFGEICECLQAAELLINRQ